MNLHEILQFVNYVANKEQTGNTLSPLQYNTVLNVINLKLFSRYIGLEEEYLINLPIARKMVEVSQRVTEEIKQFKVAMNGITTPYLITDANGFAQYPTDYKYPLSLAFVKSDVDNCSSDTNLIPIDVLTDGQFVNRRNNALLRPDEYSPIANFQADYMRFLPNTVRYVEFHYLRLPITPIYDYYINSYGEQTYLAPNETRLLSAGEEGSAGQTTGIVASLTVEHEWNNLSIIPFIFMILQEIGVNLREQQITQYSQMIKQTGA